jgi:DNA-binding transcriptional MerR regulator
MASLFFVPMMEQDFSLGNLAAAAGLEPRTIRNWIAQGLLKGPESMGRNARYTADHLARLKAIRALKEIYGLALADIRRELLVADEERIQALGRRVEPGTRAPSDDRVSASDPVILEPPARSSALEYIRALKGSGSSPTVMAEAPEAGRTAGRTRPQGGIEQLLHRLETTAGSAAPRHAKGEVWFHIPVTPDLILAVRGGVDPDTIARFERVAGLLRDLLLRSDTDSTDETDQQ